MTKTLKLSALFVGALALTATLAMAEGKCGDAPKTMKCESGKCASGKKEMHGKCGNATKEAPATPAPSKGKCGQGKCG